MAANLPVEQFRDSWVSPQMPNYGAELIKTVNAYINAERAMARASGRGSGAGGLKVTGQGTVIDPLTGEQKQVPLHGTKDERKVELDTLQQNAVNAALASKMQGQALGDISKMSVEKGEKTLSELQTNMVNELSRNAPSLRQSFQQSVQGALSPLREDINQRKKAIKESSNWDILASAASSAGNYIRQMIEPDERKGVQIARERAAQEAADRQANAYLENQYRRMQEGEGAWSRMWKGTGSMWLNTLGGAIEMAPALGPTLAAGGIGSFFGGPVGAGAAAGAVGALTGTADLYSRLVAEHPDWTDEQLVEAAKRGTWTARATGAATNAVLFPAGKLASRIPVAGRLISGQGTIPTMARTYAEIAPMAVGYQMGQNVAYNVATGQDTLSNVMQGTGDVLAGTVPFAGAIGAGKIYMARRAAKPAGDTSTTATPDTSEQQPVTSASEMFKAERESLSAEKKQAEAQKQEAISVQEIAPEVRTNTVESLFDILSKETDADNIKSTVRSLQDMEVSIDAIKQRVSGFTGANSKSVQDYVNSLVDANTSIKDFQTGIVARQAVNDLVARIGMLLTRTKKGNITGYDTDAVQEASRILDNLPKGVTQEYVTALLNELAKQKGRSKTAIGHANSTTLAKLFNVNSKSAPILSKFLAEVRADRINRAVKTVNDAQGLSEALTNVRQQVDANAGVGDAQTGADAAADAAARKDMVTDGQPGEARATIPDSSLDSQLDTPEPGAAQTPADGSTPKAIVRDGDVKERGLSGETKPDDSTITSPESLTQTNEVISGEGINGGAGIKPATTEPAKQGKGDGGDATQAGGRPGSTDDAASLVKQGYADSTDAGYSVKWQAMAQDATRGGKNTAKKKAAAKDAFDRALSLKQPSESIVELRDVLRNNSTLDNNTRSFLQGKLNKLLKDNQALAQGEELSPTPNLPPHPVYPTLNADVSSAMRNFSLSDASGAATTARALIASTQKKAIPVQDVFNALDDYRSLTNQTNAEIEKALQVMGVLRDTYDKSLTIPEKTIEAIDRVCGN